ncbi:unnamed protein product [Orchesella dallaii]|uniref:BTB domain-containing protein n=1 Tax=Orchesella dallaii TaxID=48710 RepID=A0ABP1Q451_9HEXA
MEERNPISWEPDLMMKNNGTCTIYSTEERTFESHGDWLLENAFMSLKTELYGCFLLVGGTGEPVGIHKTVLLRFSKLIADLYEDNPLMITISVDFATEHILKKFVQMLYGITVFSDQEQLQQIQTVFKQLDIPYSESSFDIFKQQDLFVPDNIGNETPQLVIDVDEEGSANGMTHQNPMPSPPDSLHPDQLIANDNSHEYSNDQVLGMDNLITPVFGTHLYHTHEHGSDEHPEQFIPENENDVELQNFDNQDDASNPIDLDLNVEGSEQVVPTTMKEQFEVGSNQQELELENTLNNTELQSVNDSNEQVAVDETEESNEMEINESEIPIKNVSTCVDRLEKGEEPAVVVTKLMTVSEYIEKQKEFDDDTKPMPVYNDEDVKEMIKNGSISISKLENDLLNGKLAGMPTLKPCGEAPVSEQNTPSPVADSDLSGIPILERQTTETTENDSVSPVTRVTLNPEQPEAPKRKRKYETEEICVASEAGRKAELAIVVPIVHLYVDDDGKHTPIDAQENVKKIKNQSHGDDITPPLSGTTRTTHKSLKGKRSKAVEEVMNKPKRSRGADEPSTSSSETCENKPEAASKRGRPRKRLPTTKPDAQIENEPKPTTSANIQI